MIHMEIQMVVEFCCIDGKPTNKSPAYKMVKFLLGEKVAKSVTYEVTFPR